MGRRPENELGFSTKRCPDCSAELPLDAESCHECGSRVLKVDRVGRAGKPIDWYAYIVCFLSWLAFGLYTWWAFFKK
jgi:ribosomal protein L40E